jgi:hypothetical protein
MKNCYSRILGAAIIAFAFAAAVSAQNDTLGAAAGDRYVISAKAGGVNYVSGAVGIIRTEGKSGQLLKGDKLEIGDRVSTGDAGKAEILLNPGSYLRLGSLSAFEFKTTNLDDLQIKLDSGSAIFEVFATEDFTITVNTPKTKFTLIESGVYRIDADGIGKVSVWKGKALVGDDEKAIVRSGREGVLNGGQAAMAKFDRDDKDDLELWSKDRAKDLAKITGTLQRNTMRTALMRSFLGRQWNVYNSFGLWIYDPFSGSNCFLPFGWGWGSPYGYGFGSSIWNYNLPGVVFYPPANGGGNNGGGPIRTAATVKPGRGSVGPIRHPPFAQVQGTSGSTGRDVSVVKPGRSADTGPMIVSDPIRSSGEYSGSSGPSSTPSSHAPVRVVRDSKPGRP